MPDSFLPTNIEKDDSSVSLLGGLMLGLLAGALPLILGALLNG